MKKRVLSMFLSVLMIFSMVPLSVFSDGGTTGNVVLTKALKSPIPDANGNYTLELTVSGKPVTTTTQAAAADVVLVVDTSGSMSTHIGNKCNEPIENFEAYLSRTINNNRKNYNIICPTCGDEYSISAYANADYAYTNNYVFYRGYPLTDEGRDALYADYLKFAAGQSGTPIRTHNLPGTLCTGEVGSPQSRMEIAKDVAEDFAEAILSHSGNQIALVGFAHGDNDGGANDPYAITVSTELTNRLSTITGAISDMDAEGGTNYSAALQRAYNILANRTDTSRPGYVVFITDGSPGYSGGNYTNTNWNGAIQAAYIRNAYTFYTVGIELTGTEAEYLKGMASVNTNDHFFNLSSNTSGSYADQLRTILLNWAEKINTFPAGTDAILTDIVTDDFTIVGEVSGAQVSGNTVTWNIGDITETPKSISITIKPNDGLSGTVFTNDYCVLTYIDPYKQQQTKEATSPAIDFIQINAEKVWEGNNVRPAAVTVGLNADGAHTGKTIVLSDANNWQGSFSSLPAHKLVGDTLLPITYSLYEEAVPGYTSSMVLESSSNGVYNYTITNTAATRSILVSKVWDDANNQDGLRPASVELHIVNAANTAEHIGTPVVLTAANADSANANVWSAEVSVPNDGRTFAVLEESTPEGYTVNYDQTAYTVTNTHIPETIAPIVVEKEWDDSNNQDGKRPASVTVHLLANGREVASATLTERVNWQAIFGDITALPKYADGQRIYYSITEDQVPLYGTEITGNATDGFTVRNFYPAEVAQPITVSKVWDDDNNRDGIRPTEIIVKLMANGNPVRESVLSATNGWTASFTGLPVYNAGQIITYTVDEVTVPGYTTKITGSAQYGFTVTNTHEPAKYDEDGDEFRSIIVSKIWNDSDNQDGKRPAAITVYLKNGTTTAASLILNAANNWTGTFQDVYVYENGKMIAYSVEEAPVAGYTSSYSGSAAAGFTITNTYAVERTSVTVNKVWADNNNQDGIRPASITAVLYANGQPVGKRVVLNDANGWTATFTDLPVYNAGQVINYTVDEASVPAGYTKSVNGFTITNTHEPAKYDDDLTDQYGPITITKIWDDANNQDGKRPGQITVTLTNNLGMAKQYTISPTANSNVWTYSIPDEYPVYANGQLIEYSLTEQSIPGYTGTVSAFTNGGFTVTNSYTVANTSVTVNKVWADNNNQDGIRPASVTAVLYADGQPTGKNLTLNDANGWTATFADLPVYNAGKVINYTVDEASVPTGYTKSVNGFTITNTHEPAKYDDEDDDDRFNAITVKKIWNDANNNDGKRPESVTIYLSDGHTMVDTLVLSAANNWQGSFKAVPVYENGQKIPYTIKEASVDGYQASYYGSLDTIEEGFTVTNTHISETVDVTVTKIWEHKTNPSLPTSVEIHLLADGKHTGAPVTLTMNNAAGTDNTVWTYTYTSLPKYAGGEEIFYSISEKDVENYTASISADGKTITNTYTPGYTSVSVEKVWEDNHNQDGKRPTEVTVILRANGSEYNRYTLNAANHWRVVIGGLDENYTYTVDEIVPTGYSSVVTSSATNDFTVTNTYSPEVYNEITVEKVWDDRNNNDGKRPASIEVNLLANGITVDTVTLDESNGWKNSFRNKSVFENGREINYSVEEVPVAGYTPRYSGSAAAGFTITNTYSLETTSVTVKKVWNDENNQDNIRPTSVTAVLYADGQPTDKRAELNDSNSWSYTFTGLQAYIAGVKIIYTVKEETVPAGYTNTVSGFILTNTHEPVKYDKDDKDSDGNDSITVTKIWEDANNQDGIRPKQVIVYLKNGDDIIDTLTLNADNNWIGSFKDVPVYENGAKIAYAVTEDAVNGYTTTITGSAAEDFTVTNTHVPATYEQNDPEFDQLTVTKIWNDANNQDGIRPDSVTVTLMANGSAVPGVAPLTLNANNNWTDHFVGVPVFENGVAIAYTIAEERVGNYEVDSMIVYLGEDNGPIDAFRLTNTHEPVKYDEDDKDNDGNDSITVEKIWRDDHNRDGFRPESVTIHLKADGIIVDTLTLSAADETVDGVWRGHFKDVPVYRDGGVEIVYTVEEEAIAHYEATIRGNAQDDFTVLNAHFPETLDNSLTVTKVWNDDNNRDGKRPEKVIIRLLKNGVEFDHAEANANNGWKVSFPNLYRYENGKLIDWSVVEDAVSDYSSSEAEGTLENGFTITNSYTPGRTSLTVVKVWDDENNQDGKRPETITAKLMIVETGANGQPSLLDTGKSVILSEANHWTAIFTHLYEYENGQRIQYTVEEALVPEEYTANIIVPYSKEQYTIVNSYIPADYDDEEDDDDFSPITVTKIWSDDLAMNAYQPDAITVDLYKLERFTDDNGTVHQQEIKLETITLSESNNWKAAFGSHPVYANGEKIVYLVKEADVSGYASEVLVDYGEKSIAFTLVNEFNGEVADLTITKEITGNLASTSDLFTFKIILDDTNAVLSIPEGGLFYTGTLNGRDTISGMISSGDTFRLQGNGSITIHGIPVGTFYTVSETNTLGYTLRAYHTSGTLEEDSTARFVNTKHLYIPIIPIIPQPEPEPEIPDLPDILNTEDHFAYIIGYPDGTVRPEREITRAEVATIFFRMLTDDAREQFWSTTNSFTDVTAGQWYNNAISTLTNVGVINGYPDGSFKPNAPITRAEIVKIAVSFFDFVEANTHLFSDVDGHWAEAYIDAAAEKGIIQGYPDGTFKPNNNVTRAEAMTIINNVLGRKPCKDRLLDEMIVWPDNSDESIWYYEAVQEATNSHEYRWIDPLTKKCEQWTKLLPVRDWATLELAWEANMVPNPGEVLNNP